MCIGKYKYRRKANPILRPSLTFPNFSPGTALPSPRVCLHAGFSRFFLLSFDFYRFDSIITRTIPFKDNQPCDHLNNPLFFQFQRQPYDNICRQLYLKSQQRVWGLDDNYWSNFPLIFLRLNSNANLVIHGKISFNSMLELPLMWLYLYTDR